MNLSLPIVNLEKYKSLSQRARVGTESWGAANFFCSSCDSPQLNQALHNSAAVDFICPKCDATYQLKSLSRPFGKKIVDSAYSEMKKAMLGFRSPNLIVMHYDLTSWAVRTVLLIPKFAFTFSCIERRKPLAATARRAGWIGCNIRLDKIPRDARISVIDNGKVQSPSEVRNHYQRLRPLEDLKLEKRGWTLDVLLAIRSINKPEFTIHELYARSDNLAKMHPRNSHVREKIRQQLQVLRDLGFLTFAGNGRYLVK